MVFKLPFIWDTEYFGKNASTSEGFVAAFSVQIPPLNLNWGKSNSMQIILFRDFMLNNLNFFFRKKISIFKLDFDFALVFWKDRSFEWRKRENKAQIIWGCSVLHCDLFDCINKKKGENGIRKSGLECTRISPPGRTWKGQSDHYPEGRPDFLSSFGASFHENNHPWEGRWEEMYFWDLILPSCKISML